MDVYPIAVRIIDSVGMIWFYAYGESLDADGVHRQFSSKRLEILQKTDDGWKLVGGMAGPIETLLPDGS